MYLIFKASRAILGPTQPSTQWKTAYIPLWIERPGRELTIHPNLMPRLRMTGAIKPMFSKETNSKLMLTQLSREVRIFFRRS